MTKSDNVLRRVWLAPSEVQTRTGISRTEVYAALQTGELRGYQRGKNSTWRVHVDDCDAWVRGEVKTPA